MFESIVLILILAAITIATIFSVYERGVGTFLSLAAAVGIIHFTNKFNVIEYAMNNWTFLLFMAVAYFAVGVVWSYFKWWMYLNDLSLYRSKPYYVGDVKRFMNDQMGRILHWIGYWPLSMLWFVIDDFFFKVAKAIYNKISFLYTNLAMRILPKEWFEEK